MALLYQQIMDVPGLTGTWKQRADQYMRALTGKAYDGSKQTGLYLLSQISKKNFPQAQQSQPQQAAPAPTVNPGQAAGEAQAYNFDEVLPFEQYFDPNLARSSAEQTAAAYYAPIAQKERGSLETGFANRGLTRSGQRGTAISDLYGNLAQRQQADIEQDRMGMKSQAQEEYKGMQELYERTQGKQKPAATAYEGYGYTPPQLSAGRYGTSYQNWLNSVLGGLN